MTPRQRVLAAVNHQVPDRVPIDLGGMKASGIAVTAYDRLKRKLGIRSPTKVLDPRFMIAVVEDEVLRRLHADVVPLDLSGIVGLVRPDAQWVGRRLFDGTEALFPPGTQIAEDAAGNWVLLAADGSPTAYRMPKSGFYFDNKSFNQGDGASTRRSSAPSPTSPTSTCGSWATTPGGFTTIPTTPFWAGGSASVSWA